MMENKFIFKRFIVLFVFFPLLNCNNLFGQFPNFIILSGQIVHLPARTYTYSNFEIKSGGELIIDENSQQWCIFHVTGEIKITGKITYRKFISSLQTVTGVSPQNIRISHTYSQLNTGGEGGNGGYSRAPHPPIKGLGGFGAKGTNQYGGGGGSGAIIISIPPTSTTGNGTAASDYHGAMAESVYNGSGGDGGIRNPYGNGGLIYFFGEKDFDGLNGIVDLRGEDGENGKSGGPAFPSSIPPHGAGAGGGGGGAPGGEGGRLIVKILGIYKNNTIVLVSGGKGGEGGSSSGSGQLGKNGQTGATGFVDYLK